MSTLVECAILVALSFVLSLIPTIPFPWLIYGGSVTLLSMLPVCVAGLRHGAKWGLGAAFVYSITQALVSGAAGWGLSIKVLIVCYLLDYILAFTVLGLCGFFKGKSTIIQTASVAGVCVLRFICHYMSGVTIWEASCFEKGFTNPYLYSLIYNGSYMLPEIIFTSIGAFFVNKAFKSRQML